MGFGILCRLCGNGLSSFCCNKVFSFCFKSKKKIFVLEIKCIENTSLQMRVEVNGMWGRRARRRKEF